MRFQIPSRLNSVAPTFHRKSRLHKIDHKHRCRARFGVVPAAIRPDPAQRIADVQQPQMVVF
jgi:hypothetical protein